MRHHGLGRAWRTLGIGALVGMSTLLLVACSSDDDGADTETTTTSTATAEATTTTTEATASASATEAPTETAAATEAATESPAAGSGTTISVATEGDLAPYLVGPEGLTLYMFTNDADGVSNCSGQCATNWPPLVVADGEEPTASEDAPGELGVIEREDGLGRQVTYNGMPLYYWVGDTAPGQTSGHEVGGVWFVVPPTEAAASAGISQAAGGDGPGY